MSSSLPYIPEQAVLAAAPPQLPQANYVKGPYKRTNGGWYELTDAGTENLLIHHFRAVLAANLTINSTTLTAVPGFTFNVPAGQTWLFEASLIGDVFAAPDIRVQCNAPGATGRFVASSMESAVSRHAAMNALTAAIALTTGNDEIRVSGGFTTAGAATFTMQLRNDVGVTAQTFYGGSWFRAERVV